MSEPVRAVMLDPDWFGDVEAERTAFEDLLDDVVVEAVDCEASEIPEEVGDADLLLSHYTAVSATAMDATGCSVIARYATGIDGIDVDAATERGVRVTRVPEYCDEEVGVHIVSLAMALVRGLPEYDAATQDGGWDWRDVTPLSVPAELRMGFLAFGRKARAAAKRARALGFDVQAYDPYLEDDEIAAHDADPVDFETLLETTDVLSVNTPLTEETDGLLDADALSRLPEGALLVNTSRGAVVDEAALVEALDSGQIRAAGLDVLASEPPAEDNPLLGREDTIVTPHAAWYSERSASTLRRRGTENAVAALRGEAGEGLVNPDALEE